VPETEICVRYQRTAFSSVNLETISRCFHKINQN
jgi:hypothetical protein